MFEGIQLFQNLLFEQITKSLEIVSRRFLRQSKKLTQSFWSDLESTFTSYAPILEESTQQQKDQENEKEVKVEVKETKMKEKLQEEDQEDQENEEKDEDEEKEENEENEEIDQEDDHPKIGEDEEPYLCPEAFIYVYLDTFCFKRLNLLYTLLSECTLSEKLLSESWFLSPMLVRLLASGHCSPNVGFLIPKILSYFLSQSNPDSIIEFLKRHGESSPLFKFSLRAFETNPSFSPFLQLTLIMISHLTRPMISDLKPNPNLLLSSNPQGISASSSSTQTERSLESTRTKEANLSTDSIGTFGGLLPSLTSLSSMTYQDDLEHLSNQQVSLLCWTFHDKFSLASEIISLVRLLLKKANQNWRNMIYKGLENSLSGITKIETLISSKQEPFVIALTLLNCHSSLMILGGFIESLRPGIQVFIDYGKEGFLFFL